MSASPQPSPLMVPRILWIALLVSQGIYAALLLMPGVVETAPPDRADPAILLALAAAALGVAVASFAMPAFLRRTAFAQLSIPTREVPDPEALQGFRAARTIREYVDPAAARRRALALAFTPFILSVAFSEAVSIFGFIVGFLGHPITAWAPFIAAGMTLTAIRFPTERAFFGPFEAKTGVPLPR